MRGKLLFAVVVSVLVAAGVSAGCGASGEAAISPESAQACLEGVGADVVSPPLQSHEASVFRLAPARPTSVAIAGLPSGSVAAVSFYETAEDASTVQATLRSPPPLLAGLKPLMPELHGNAVFVWQNSAKESDNAILARCLEEGDANIGEATSDPVKPLGCVRLFIAADAGAAKTRRVRDALRSQSLVREVRFVSKQDALDQMRRKHPELTKNLSGNPLPDSFSVGPKRGQEASQIADSARGYPGVDTVQVSSYPCSLASSVRELLPP